jgi:hypothetical protein
MVEQSTVMGQLLAQLVDVAAELVIDAASEGAAAVITAPDSALECARLVVAGLRTLHVTIELIHAGRDEAAALAQGLGAIRAAFRPPPLPAGIPALPVPIR